jgi:hypothetical protein
MMKKISFFSILLLAVLFIFACTDSYDSDLISSETDMGIRFRINGIAASIDPENPDKISPSTLAYTNSPIVVEGIPDDAAAEVTYKSLNGYESLVPLPVMLTSPIEGVPPQGMIIVTVTTEKGRGKDYFLLFKQTQADRFSIDLIK